MALAVDSTTHKLVTAQTEHTRGACGEVPGIGGIFCFGGVASSGGGEVVHVLRLRRSLRWKDQGLHATRVISFIAGHHSFALKACMVL